MHYKITMLHWKNVKAAHIIPEKRLMIRSVDNCNLYVQYGAQRGALTTFDPVQKQTYIEKSNLK